MSISDLKTYLTIVTYPDRSEVIWNQEITSKKKNFNVYVYKYYLEAVRGALKLTVLLQSTFPAIFIFHGGM